MFGVIVFMPRNCQRGLPAIPHNAENSKRRGEMPGVRTAFPVSPKLKPRSSFRGFLHFFFHFIRINAVNPVRNTVRVMANHVYGMGRSTVLIP